MYRDIQGKSGLEMREFVQQEQVQAQAQRMLEVQEGHAHFNKKERSKKEQDEGKDCEQTLTNSQKPLTAPKALSPHKHLISSSGITTPPTHSNNTKMKNSPITTGQSPKAKEEATVRSSPVTSPLCASQLDTKLSNQAKQGSTSQPQASPCDSLIVSGNHGSKAAMGGNLGLKNGQGLGTSSAIKGKGKRERSMSADSFEQRDAGTPNNESEHKDGGSRSKRLCVAERRQPYSGAEWCSGTESEEEERTFFNCNSSESVKSQEHLATHSLPSSNPDASGSSNPSHNSVGSQKPMPESSTAKKTPPKVIYVFSTNMANKAAEAVLKGEAETILSFHMQNISNRGTEKEGPASNSPQNKQLSAHCLASLTHQQSCTRQKQKQNQQDTTRMLQNQSQQGLISKQVDSHETIDQDNAGVDNKVFPDGSPQNSVPLSVEDSCGNSVPSNQTPTVVAPNAYIPTSSLESESKNEPKEAAQPDSTLNIGENPEGLSQEQLKHRERSLQTLRDIQRMLFPESEHAGTSDSCPMQNTAGHEVPSKKPEGAAKSMISQSPSVGKLPSSRPEARSFGTSGHRDVVFQPADGGPPQNVMSSQVGQELVDHMTPEQLAWLKLQQEFYEEKRRKQEQTVHPRTVQDLLMHQHGPRRIIGGPPPPYQINPGEGWVPGGSESFQGVNPPNTMHPRGRTHHSGIHGHRLQRMPSFTGMLNPDIDSAGGPNPAPRLGLPGVNWPDDMPKMTESRNFSHGPGLFCGAGRAVRFPNPQNMQDDLFHQQLPEKQLRMSPGVGMEMNRLLQLQRHLEPANGNIFPRLPGEGIPSPIGMEFSDPKGLPLQSGPVREMEVGMMSSSMNMNMNVNMNLEVSMNSQTVSQKHGSGTGQPHNMSPGDDMKIRQSNNGEMLAEQPKILPSQFSGQSQDFMGSPPLPGTSQGPGAIRNPRDQFVSEQLTNTGSNARLSHIPPLPPNVSTNPSTINVIHKAPRGLGRKPSDLNVSSQASSPGMNSLKSPTIRQVQSPVVGSPSTNLKSPQTPSQLTGILSGQVAAASIKSPSVIRSAATSPVHLKSPALPAPSPGWTSSPKPRLQSPVIQPSTKPPLSLTSPGMMATMESGPRARDVEMRPNEGDGVEGATALHMRTTENMDRKLEELKEYKGVPVSGQSGSVNLSGSLPSHSPYSMPPEPSLSQNPLSIMMSRMSKFAMPSSTPLYHDAIKTVASSDDDSPPVRSPNLPSMNHVPGISHLNQTRLSAPHSAGQMPSLSPMGMNVLGGQPLSHHVTNQMPSPNAIGPNMASHGPVGPNIMPHGPMMLHTSQDPSVTNPQMLHQGRMGFLQGQQIYPSVQSPTHQVSFPVNDPGPQGVFPPGIAFSGEGGLLGRPNSITRPSPDQSLCKTVPPGMPDSYAAMGNHMPSVYNDPELQDVIRPNASGIPEFDLSRIIPSEKPSQTLQYFPHGDSQGRKQLQLPSPGFSHHMQGLMGEANPGRMGLPIPSVGGHSVVGVQEMAMGNAASVPGHNPMRLPGFMHQGMMGPQHRIMSPPQGGVHTPMNNPNALMIQGKERVPGSMYSHPGSVGSPQHNLMMPLPGMVGPQQNMMIPPQMRPRGLTGDVGMDFNQGPGSLGNMMF
ncbi:B-cell CLL/lymphoma 9 protein isoform X1 [Chiloscyllium plagiosum]|uniref:B-cell CLL/lymphoma 9 protein isoform X1 n=1 Tax=Chiloscyllium plagiosum TaxID=36176 RepID=UPI001CB831C4|nr:B-cell CLL/lymphoma 9 protein isoform X1 [Chiloscyllium plagiosum]XP_043547388.1 B-cell CLL/lymphoma 9 protein isoform X1 [Chiloscyllium plagiosum]